MTSDAVWSILLLLAAISIVAIEFVVPSGGLLAILATAATIAAVVVGFKAGWIWGMSVVTAAVFALPTTIIAMFRVLPYTPMGKRLMHRPEPLTHPHADEVADLVGKVGVVLSELLPAGMIEVEGERHEALAPGVVIRKGEHVEVLRVSGGVLYVAATDRELTKPESNPTEILERPLSDLGIEELK
jgi:membrane-bound ClpP family serine protease